MSTSAIASASDIQMDYMKLLVTQLQNQNPLEPLNNNEMASQLAQFSQLQQLESMNTNFSEILSTAKSSYANSLLGKTVTFYSPNEDGTLEKKVGRVDSVLNDRVTGDNLLGVKITQEDGVEEYTLSLDAVLLVEN